MQSPTEQENVSTPWMPTDQPNSDVGPHVENSNTTEPCSPYQPVIEPISPVQCDPDGKSNAAAGDTSPVQSDDKVVTTTPPSSPPLTPSHDDECQNTDCDDTEEYEDSISDPTTINGNNIPLDNEPVDILKPANNLTSIDDTTVVNVSNVPTQCTTNGDNESSYLNDDTSCDIMKGQNTDPNRDTNGRNTLKVVSDPKDDTDMNSHNNNESTPLSSTENRWYKFIATI